MKTYVHSNLIKQYYSPNLLSCLIENTLECSETSLLKLSFAFSLDLQWLPTPVELSRNVSIASAQSLQHNISHGLG
ncbi:hypothetical protein V5799_009537 [Amblyomma americanum]|uniref:Uncharacterized protein n=1 Tax=Amblyomma americanum TaxID=6943 RepID=A0AAQ4FAN3_AMBAM